MDLAHHNEFKDHKLVAEMEPDSLFADLIESVPGRSGMSDREKVARATKNIMWLIAGIRSRLFPLKGCQTLYVNIRNQDGPDTMTLKWNTTLETADGIKTSLDAAEQVYHPNSRQQYGSKRAKIDGLDTGKTKGNAWVQIRVGGNGLRYTTLSELFAHNF